MDLELLRQWAVGLLPFALLFFGVGLLDMVWGVLIALRDKEFRLEWVPDFLIKWGTFLMGWLSAEALVFFPTFLGVEIEGWQELVSAVAPKVIYGLMVLKYVGSIIEHIQETQNGVLNSGSK